MLDVKNEINLNEVYSLKRVNNWKKKYPILDSIVIQDWIKAKMIKFMDKGKNPGKFQASQYIKDLYDFCEFYEAEPHELLLENQEQRSSRLRDYLISLRKDGKSECSLRNSVQSHIKSYYAYHEKPIKYQLECLKAGKIKDKIVMIPETARRLLKHLSPQYQLLVKTQSLLGLRLEDTLHELTKDENNEPKYKFEKYMNHYYIRGFETQKEVKIMPFLFVPKELENTFKAIYGIENLTEIDLRECFKSKLGNRIDPSNYNTRLKEVLKTIGIEQKKIGSHVFRKMFRTMIRNAEVDGAFKEFLMSHATKDLTATYEQNLQDIDMFYKDWLKVEPFLYIETEFVDKTDERIVELEKKFNEELIKKDLIIKSQSKDIVELNARIDKFSKQIGELGYALKKLLEKEE